jgi:hypothetical protein
LVTGGPITGRFTLDESFDGVSVTKPDGIIYLVSGAGGADLYSEKTSGDRATWPPFTAKYVNTQHSLTVLDVDRQSVTIRQLGASGELGIFHASAKTTRGCLSTDDGWIGSLLTAAAKTGQLKHVFVEIFHHEDPALAPLRNMDPGHGIDTRDGRTYLQVTTDGLADVARRLNGLSLRGTL